LAAGGPAFGFGAGFCFCAGSSDIGCGLLGAASVGGCGVTCSFGGSLTGTPSVSSSEFQRSFFPGSVIKVSQCDKKQ
jgi:hypothetical protein